MGDTLSDVQDIIVELLGVDSSKVTPEARFREDLEADSLDIVELIMAFEDKFGNEISDEDAQNITTVGEGVFSDPGSMSMDSCTEKGKHSAGACDATSDILDGATVMSIHSSTAKLKVIVQDPSAEPMFLVGTLKGKLAATITISSSGGDVLSGPGTLKIRSTDLPSTYICLGAGFVPVELADCINASGPQTFGAGPVMVPAELHVIDTGKFSIESPTSGIQMKGKLQVVVDVIGVAASGKIEVTKGRAIFP
ncbi:MAG: acyl carrier protein [Chloroflexi bacterium]|nr:acyl carrier protein [Chloroflexota bacterium]